LIQRAWRAVGGRNRAADLGAQKFLNPAPPHPQNGAGRAEPVELESVVVDHSARHQAADLEPGHEAFEHHLSLGGHVRAVASLPPSGGVRIMIAARLSAHKTAPRDETNAGWWCDPRCCRGLGLLPLP